MFIIFIVILITLFSCGGASVDKKQVVNYNVAVLPPQVKSTVFNLYVNESKTQRNVDYYFVKLISDVVEQSLKCDGLFSKLVSDRIIKLTLVDREYIKKLFEEWKFQSAFTKEGISKMGDVLNADILIFVEPRYLSIKKSKYISKKSKIPLVSEEKDFKCVSVSGSAKIFVKAINTSSGKVIVSGVFDGKSDYYEQCDELNYRTNKIPTEEEIVSEAILRAGRKFSKELCSVL